MPRQIARVLASFRDVEAIAAALIGIADIRGARDDVTCIVLRCRTGSSSQPVAGPPT